MCSHLIRILPRWLRVSNIEAKAAERAAGAAGTTGASSTHPSTISVRIDALPPKTIQGGGALDGALLQFVETQRDVTKLRAHHAKLAEIPFSSANKFMVSVHVGVLGPIVIMKGAPV